LEEFRPFLFLGWMLVSGSWKYNCGKLHSNYKEVCV